MEKIAVVVPTIREDKLQEFLRGWKLLFDKHNVDLYIVKDGEEPTVNGETVRDIMGDYSDLIFNNNDGVRNLGFVTAFRNGADVIITLDDDVLPIGDTIQDHIDTLNNTYPTSWLNTVDEVYMRGFPYGIREEAECVLSHGLWQGVADFDGQTQLKIGTPKVTNRRMPIPKGILFPMCIMNVAFKRKLTPYMYQAPMFADINRFADIWSGIEVKKVIDSKGWCAVSGYAEVLHQRASNPKVNVEKEKRGLEMNERYGEDPYFEFYKVKRNRWEHFLNNML